MTSLAYYEQVSRHNTASPFLSPCRDPSYTRGLAAWLADAPSRRVAELGPGFGDLIEQLGVVGPPDLRVWAIDGCRDFLDIAKRRWPGEPERLVLVHADLDADVVDPPPVPEGFGRVAAINVFQDIDLRRGLRRVRAWLAPGGLVRATVLAKETMDEFYGEHPLYDVGAGMYYQPVATASELGRRDSAAGSVPYERVLRFHTREASGRAFVDSGFEVVKVRPINVPGAQMLDRWQAAGRLHTLSPSAIARLRVGGSYLDSREYTLRCRG